DSPFRYLSIWISVPIMGLSSISDEVAHGGGSVRRRPAQVEGVLVGAGDQPADEQVLAVDAGGGHRPVAVARPFGSVAAGAALEHRVRHGLISADRRAGRGTDRVVAGDDR